MIGKALLAILLLAPAQAAPAWPKFRSDVAKTIFAVDPASIAGDRQHRLYRGRLTKDGDRRTAMVYMTANCAVQTVGLIRIEMYADGKRLWEKPGTAAMRNRSIKGDPATEAIFAYVCRR